MASLPSPTWCSNRSSPTRSSPPVRDRQIPEGRRGRAESRRLAAPCDALLWLESIPCSSVPLAVSREQGRTWGLWSVALAGRGAIGICLPHGLAPDAERVGVHRRVLPWRGASASRQTHGTVSPYWETISPRKVDRHAARRRRSSVESAFSWPACGMVDTTPRMLSGWFAYVR